MRFQNSLVRPHGEQILVTSLKSVYTRRAYIKRNPQRPLSILYIYFNQKVAVVGWQEQKNSITPSCYFIYYFFASVTHCARFRITGLTATAAQLAFIIIYFIFRITATAMDTHTIPYAYVSFFYFYFSKICLCTICFLIFSNTMPNRWCGNGANLNAFISKYVRSSAY